MATISSNTDLTVPNKSGSYDGDMVVKQYSSLTINSGVTLSTDNGCKGLLIYVQGDCVINGTINVKPGNADPSSAGVPSGGLTYPIIQSSGSSVSSGDFSGTGSTAPGVISTYVNATLSGKVGTMFALNRTGSNDNSDETGPGGFPGYAPGCCFGQGNGSRQNGTAFGGGGGMGGSCGCHGSNPGSGTRTQGGNGGSYGCHGQGGGGGGAGYPNGSGGQNAGSGSSSTKNGVLWLIVGGNLSGTGSIDLRGVQGGTAGQGGYSGSGGGGSGGGACFIAVKGTNTFCATGSGSSSDTSGTGNVYVDGGSAGSGTSANSGGGCQGVAGENGWRQVVAMA